VHSISGQGIRKEETERQRRKKKNEGIKRKLKTNLLKKIHTNISVFVNYNFHYFNV